jgi:hypothetical protein
LGVGLAVKEAVPDDVDDPDDIDDPDAVEEVNGEPAGMGRMWVVGSWVGATTIGTRGGNPRMGMVQGALDGWVLAGGSSVNVTDSNSGQPP